MGGSRVQTLMTTIPQPTSLFVTLRPWNNALYSYEWGAHDREAFHGNNLVIRFTAKS